MKTTILLVSLLLIGFLMSGPLAAEPYLVRDFHQGLAEPAGFTYGGVPWNGFFYLASFDPAHGTEIWRTDGTPGNAERITDICPGPCNAAPQLPMVFGDHLYFLANDGVSGSELWRSNGTPGNAERVRDLCPGPCDSGPNSLTPLGGRLLFVAADPTALWLWRTDGTRRGTVRVAALCPRDFACLQSGFRPLGGLLLFARQGVDRIELWRTDGTPAGTHRVPDPPSGPLPSIEAGPATAAGGQVTFWAGGALWRSDGTAAGTIRLKSLEELATAPEPVYSQYPGQAVAWNGAIYWTLSTGELIRSDGTAAGTVRVWDFGTTAPVLLPREDEILAFLGTLPVPEIWRTRGTPETTEKVVEDLGSGSIFISQVEPLGEDRAIFIVGGREGSGVYEIWVTDGTAAGTHRIEAAPSPRDAYGLLAAGNEVFYLTGTYEIPGALWRTDGTEAGTFEVQDQKWPASSGPLDQIVLGDQLIFSARTSATEAPLFASDGTPAGTRLLSEQAGWAHRLTRVGPRVFFQALEATIYNPGELPYFQYLGLWSTDGTPAGTRNISPQTKGFTAPSVLGNTLLFGAIRETNPFGYVDVELFATEGGKARLVRNIDRFAVETRHHVCVGESSDPGPGVAVGSRLFFAAQDGLNGRELWSTGGTRAGTRLVRNINPATLPGPPESECSDNTPRDHIGLGSHPENLVAFRQGVLFTADDGTTGRELWRSDGTGAGTRQVADLRPGAAGASPHDLTVFHGAVYFFASAAGAGEGLWRTDGTEAGTVLVHALSIRGLPSWGRSLTVAGGRLYFSVYNEATGAELWASRGTAATTRLLTDLNRGPANATPQSLTAIGNLLVFAADDGEHGLEPWSTNGTAAGTHRVADIAPGRDASAPGPFSIVDGVLLTGADDGEHGRELWAIPLEDL